MILQTIVPYLLPIFSKIFESILKDQINNFFERLHLLYQQQYGFRNKRSTTLAINSLTDIIGEGMEEGLNTYASFYDLTKAFDCVSHDILLRKLSFYNFNNNSISLIKSYLSMRGQYVIYDRQKSRRQSVVHGVPQGSVLGPLLFLIYINDLSNFQEDPNLILFADDTTNVIKYHPADPPDNVITQARNNIQDWFLANRLSLNETKTQSLNFSLRQGDPGVPCDGSVKFLGVLLDPKLTWEKHITQLSHSLSKAIYLIRQLSKSLSTSVIMTVYHCYFVSLMTYGILNWGHSAHSVKVFKLQRRCIRVIANLHWRECCKQYFRELRVLTFPSLYILNCLKYIKSNIADFSSHSDIHNYTTRNCKDIVPAFHRLARTRRGTDFYCIKFYNVLPDHIKCLEDKKFVTKIKNYLIEKAFYSCEDYLRNDFNDFI